MNPWLQLLMLLAVESAVVVGIAIQLQRFIQSAVWRRTIWHVCILSLLWLTIFEFTGAARDYAGWMTEVVRPARAGKIITTTASPKNQVQAHSDVAAAVPAAVEPGVSPGGKDAQISTALQNVQRIPGGRMPPSTAGGTPAATISPAHANLMLLLSSLPSFIWLLGVIVIFSRILFARVVFEIFRRRRRHVADEDSQETLRRLALKLGIRRRVRLLESDRICAPVAFGLLRPTIVLPARFTEKFTVPQQHTILSHELAHLAGHDAAWYLLADILTALLWWHPLVWRARHHLHAASELAADEASLLVANGPSVLAECLVEIGTRMTQPRMFRTMGVEGNGFRSGLGRRVERLVQLEGNSWRPPNRFRGSLARVFGPMLLVTAIILCTAWVIPPALNKGDNMKTMTQTWKQPLAALAVLASLNAAPDIVQAGPLDPRTAPLVATSPAPPTVPAPETAPVAPTPFALQNAPTPQVRVSDEKRKVEFLLDKTMIDTVKYDDLPLTEVINNLVELSARKPTSQESGSMVNFILNRERPEASATGAVDPATGLPMSAVEPIDWSQVTVKINPALRHVRLLDVLEVLVKSTSQPIKYSIESYGVVFSQDTTRSVSPQPAAPGMPAFEPLDVGTFKVDTNTFFTGLDRTFGIAVPKNATPTVVQGALKELLQKLGINMDSPNKSIFYNDVTGMVMMRGTTQDLYVIRAAIETLGGGGTVSSPGTATAGRP